MIKPAMKLCVNPTRLRLWALIALFVILETASHGADQDGWNSQYGIGSWIWNQETHDRQECRLWKSFTIPERPAVERACLRITADNFYTVTLDGREIGRDLIGAVSLSMM